VSVLIQGSQLRALLLGIRVDRATAALPQTTAANIFTVSGGRVLLTSLVGEVTTAIQAQANATKISSNPTTGSTVDLSATKDITGLEVGGFLSLITEADVTPFGAALQQQNAGAVTIPHIGIIVPIGGIELNCAASNTGSIKWSLTYIPYDDGASVAAA
jgi:hypothetical protein